MFDRDGKPYMIDLEGMLWDQDWEPRLTDFLVDGVGVHRKDGIREGNP